MQLFIIIAGKILAIVTGICFFNFLSKPYKFIFFQVILALICEITGRYIATHFHESNTWLFNWYLLVEIWFNGLAGRLLLKDKFIAKTVLPALIFLTILWLYNIYAIGIENFANWCFIATSIILVVIYFVVLFESIFTTQQIVIQPMFWLSISIILFFGCDLPYFGLRNYLLKHSINVEEHLYYVNYVLNFLRYPMVAICFFLCRRQYRMQTS